MINIEGRAITIARVRAGMTGVDLARKLFCHQAYVSMWESGRREPWWDQLYDLLPELPKIREEGCFKYCPKADVCKKDGKCLMRQSAISARRNKDIAEVVRCKDCESGHQKKLFLKDAVWCRKNERCMDLEGFCSDGTRRATNE